MFQLITPSSTDMINDVNIDTDKIRNGAWFKIKNSSFLIAHQSKPQYEFSLRELFSRRSSVDDPTMCELISQHLLLDWKNVKKPDGSDLAYSKSVAHKALLANTELKDFVSRCSKDLTNFMKD